MASFEIRRERPLPPLSGANLETLSRTCIKYEVTFRPISLGKFEGVTVEFIHLELFLLQDSAAYEFEFLYPHYFQYQFD